MFKTRKLSASNGLRAFPFSGEIFRYSIGRQPAPLLVRRESVHTLLERLGADGTGVLSPQVSITSLSAVILRPGQE